MNKRKTIAIICPPDLPIPPHKGYGGIQRSIYEFTKELNIRNSYDIFLFAPGDSEIGNIEGINLITNIQNALWGDMVENKNFLNKSEQKISHTAKIKDKIENQYIAYVSEILCKNNYDIGRYP